MIHKPNPKEDRADEVGCGCIFAALVAGVIPGIILIIADIIGDIIGDINHPSVLFKSIVILIYIIGFIAYFVYYLKNN